MMGQGLMVTYSQFFKKNDNTFCIRKNQLSVLFAFKTVCCLIISVQVYTLEKVSKKKKKTHENYFKMGFSEYFPKTILRNI